MPIDTTEQRLRSCFQAVFPELASGGIETATPESTPEWDSIATMRLTALVAEEFGVELELDRNLSFAEILSSLRQRLGVA